MTDVVFEDKDFFVNYIYHLMDNPTQVRIQKLAYLLYAIYGSTYGMVDTKKDEEFLGQEYPKYLFKADFKAELYGAIEPYIYISFDKGKYASENLTDKEIKDFFNTPERKNIKGQIDNIVIDTNSIDDFMLVSRVRQDKVWKKAYQNGDKKMDNDAIIQEYSEKVINNEL